jgi:hypothetical protein
VTFDRTMRTLVFANVLCMLGLCMLGATPIAAQQRNDSLFDMTVSTPAFRARRPRVLLDNAHHNVYVATERITPLVQLIVADGAMIDTSGRRITFDALRGYQLYAVFTAMGNAHQDSDSASAPAFGPTEIDATFRYVVGGGSLLLCVDHRPFGQSNRALAARFGVAVVYGYVEDTLSSDRWAGDFRTPIYSRANGGLANHAITRGRTSAERINRVGVFGGESLVSPIGSTVLFHVSARAVNAGDGDYPRAPLGDAQAIALRAGRGRVVITADCSMWTAQTVKRGNADYHYGMARRDLDDRQFAINTLRWLLHALD